MENSKEKLEKNESSVKGRTPFLRKESIKNQTIFDLLDNGVISIDIGQRICLFTNFLDLDTMQSIADKLDNVSVEDIRNTKWFSCTSYIRPIACKEELSETKYEEDEIVNGYPFSKNIINHMEIIDIYNQGNVKNNIKQPVKPTEYAVINMNIDFSKLPILLKDSENGKTTEYPFGAFFISDVPGKNKCCTVVFDNDKLENAKNIIPIVDQKSAYTDFIFRKTGNIFIFYIDSEIKKDVDSKWPKVNIIRITLSTNKPIKEMLWNDVFITKAYEIGKCVEDEYSPIIDIFMKNKIFDDGVLYEFISVTGGDPKNYGLLPPKGSNPYYGSKAIRFGKNKKFKGGKKNRIHDKGKGVDYLQEVNSSTSDNEQKTEEIEENVDVSVESTEENNV